jgi:hypothetical protein
LRPDAQAGAGLRDLQTVGPTVTDPINIRSRGSAELYRAETDAW